MQILQVTVFILLFIVSFNLPAQQWQFKSPMPTARKGMAAVVLEGKIWVIGGSTAMHQVLNTVEVYEPLSDSWDTQVPSLQHPRENFAAVVMNQKIYVFGGRGMHHPVSPVEMYDPNTGSWQVVSQMPNPRSGMVAVVVDSTIWLMGGSGQPPPNNRQVDIYMPATNQWIVLGAPLNFERAVPMVARFGEQVVVAGGIYFGPLQNYEIYHPGTHSWQIAGNMLYACGGAGFAVSGNWLWIIGGMGQNGTLGNVQFAHWNGTNLQWQSGPALNIARRELAAAVVDHQLFAIGGESGMEGPPLNVVESLDILVAIDEPRSPVPNQTEILKIYPNPFNSSGRARISLPETDRVELKLFDATGRQVTTLFRGKLSAGTHEFELNPKTFNGHRDMTTGVFFLFLKGTKFSASKPVYIIK